MTNFHITETKRARRPHRCETCNRHLTVGVPYAHHRGVYDGYWYTYRQHLACQALTRAWSRQTGKDWEDQPEGGDARAFVEDLGDTMMEREGFAARVGNAHARNEGRPETTPPEALRRARLGWEAIVQELPEGADPVDVEHLRQLYKEHVGCPDCGAPKYDEACTCAS